MRPKRGPRGAQDSPRATRSGPGRPKRGQEPPKTPPGGVQEGPRGRPRKGPEIDLERPGSPKGPKRPKMAPQRPQKVKTRKNCVSGAGRSKRGPSSPGRCQGASGAAQARTTPSQQTPRRANSSIQQQPQPSYTRQQTVKRSFDTAKPAFPRPVSSSLVVHLIHGSTLVKKSTYIYIYILGCIDLLFYRFIEFIIFLEKIHTYVPV